MRHGLAIGVLVWVALWPLAHRALVAAYDVNPWKLGGFAMYTTPTPPIQVVVFESAGEGLAPLEERTLPAAARQALRAFRIERHALGSLRAPDDIARAVFDARPDLDRILIAVQRMRLDPRTAQMTSNRQQYWMERSGTASATP